MNIGELSLYIRVSCDLVCRRGIIIIYIKGCSLVVGFPSPSRRKVCDRSVVGVVGCNTREVVGGEGGIGTGSVRLCHSLT